MADHDTNELVRLDSEAAMAKLGEISMQLVDRLREMYPNGRLGMAGIAVEVHFDRDFAVPGGDEGETRVGTQIELVAFSSDPRNWITKAFFQGILDGMGG